MSSAFMQARHFDLATRRHEEERSEFRMSLKLRSNLLIAPGRILNVLEDCGAIEWCVEDNKFGRNSDIYNDTSRVLSRTRCIYIN